MKRILVIRGGAIGDFVLTLPGLKLLREEFADAQIEILGYKHIVALAENRFYAQATRSIEYAALASFFARDAELPRELADYFASFELVISYLFDPDGVFQRNIRRTGVEYFIACSPKVEDEEHAALQLARSLAEIDLRLTEPAAELYPSLEDRAVAADYLGTSGASLIAVHPGSGSERKNWRIQDWAALCRWLLEREGARSLLIIGGEADAEQLSGLRSSLSEPRVQFVESLPLPHLAAVLERCALFLGHDSGISHIAAAVGAPALLLFGPTDPTVWAPANPQVHVIKAPSMQLIDISLEEVQAAATSLLA